MKKLLLFILMCFLFIQIGCTKESIVEIEDEEIKNELLDYDFSYQNNVPGAQVAFPCFFKGYNTNFNLGATLSEENRLYTYLTEYYEEDDLYYLVYIKSTLIDTLKDKAKAHEESFASNKSNYHFSKYDEEKIIDGKYLNALNQLSSYEEDDLKFYTASNFKKVSFELDGYQLVFCAKSKKAKIIENVSLKTTINKEIRLYCRVELSLNSLTKNFSLYSFTNEEKDNQKYVNDLFNYKGKRLEVYNRNYEEVTYSNYPTLGFKNSSYKTTIRVDVITKDSKEYVILDRYKT